MVLNNIQEIAKTLIINLEIEGEGEGEATGFSAKRWDRGSSEELIGSVSPCYNTQVVGPYRLWKPLRLTVLTAKSENYITAPQRLRVKET